MTSDQEKNKCDNPSQFPPERCFENRFTAEEIFERIIKDADEEISRSFRELFFSGLAAGFAITLTVLLYSTMTYSSDGNALLGSILYPLGFIYIIIGNYQLYTENTLPPVALVLERMASLPAMLWMWTIVLLGNLAGGGLGALALSQTDVLSAGAAQVLQEIANNAMALGSGALFFKAMFAGFIVAGAVWLDFSSQNTTSRFLIIYTAFLAIPLGGLHHVVVASTEAFYLLFNGSISLIPVITDLIFPILLGNTIGGVLLVTIVNYFQTPHFVQEDRSRRLSIKDWLFTFDRCRDREKLKKRIK